MSKKWNSLILALMLAVPLMVSGQTTVPSTTVTAAVTNSQSSIVVSSATNFTVGYVAYIDEEAMNVVSISGTTIGVTRGQNGTKSKAHVNAATIYVGPPNYFASVSQSGACTASATFAPTINVLTGVQYYCDPSAGVWRASPPINSLGVTLSGLTGTAGATPTAGGAALAATSGAGGASTAAATAGANGGTSTLATGAGGAGASTGTGGNGGENDITSGAGGAAAGAAATGGNGGLLKVLSGNGGGTITGGNGGEVRVGAGNGANGSTAGGTGGAVNLFSGAAGTGGTGTFGAISVKTGGSAGTAVFATTTAGATTVNSSGAAQTLTLFGSTSGKVTVADGTDTTKKFVFDPSGSATSTSLSFTSAITASRTVIFPDQSVTVIPVMNHSATAVNASTLHIVRDTCAIGSTCVVTFTGAAVFADTNYVCSGLDATSAAAVKALIGSASAVTFTGTGTDTVNYMCVGN